MELIRSKQIWLVDKETGMKSATDALCDEKLNSIRRSVVDTGVKYTKKTIHRSVYKPQTPTPVKIDRPFKDNTGTREDWLTFSNEVVAPLKPYYDRDGTMLMLNNALFPEAHFDIRPLVMYRRHQGGNFFRGRSETGCWERESVMW